MNNQNNESPCLIEAVRLTAYTTRRMKNPERCLRLLDYYPRHDLFAGEDFGGIAAKITLAHEETAIWPSACVRRRIELVLIDHTERREAARTTVRATFRKNSDRATIYVHFPADTSELIAGHTYRLTVTDTDSGAMLDDVTIHLYGLREHGRPEEWYIAEHAGIVTESDTGTVYKTVDVDSNTLIELRFDLTQNFGAARPLIMPELEMRLFLPDENHTVMARFAQPECVDFAGGSYRVSMTAIATDAWKGVYYAELLCMGHVIAGFTFRTDTGHIMGTWHDDGLKPMPHYTLEAATQRFDQMLGDVIRRDEEFDSLLNDFISQEVNSCPEKPDNEEQTEADSEETGESPEADRSVLDALDHLTGLTSVKEKLTACERMVRFNRLRVDIGLPADEAPLHAMFLGSPGTGKTTVARLMGQMLRRAGRLTRGHVVVRERATLLGQNYNSESEKTLEALAAASGGILLIDEAYQLYQPNDPRDPGKFVIETLLTALADESDRDWMLILAGYPDQMRSMFEMNPGLRSRIPETNVYTFPDFTEPELMDIAERYLAQRSYELSPEAHEALSRRLGADFAARRKNFGNARHVVNLIQTEMLPAMAMRVTSSGLPATRAILTRIEASDVPAPLEPAPVRRLGFIA